MVLCLERFRSKEFIKFVLVGGLAALVNFCSRIFLSKWFPFLVAVIIAYIIGMIVAFVLSKMLVFSHSQGKATRQFIYFTAVNVAAVAQTAIVSVGLAQYLFPQIGFYFFPEEVAHGIGVIVPVFSSYLGHKHLTFKSSPKNLRNEPSN